mmetsp:Transcript_15988/g.45961  ORF Transcript_15988/g.45961 Transcript_15988/m.45961 type:complete len:210 (-) Transcript_15988:117-746(-)
MPTTPLAARLRQTDGPRSVHLARPPEGDPESMCPHPPAEAPVHHLLWEGRSLSPPWPSARQKAGVQGEEPSGRTGTRIRFESPTSPKILPRPTCKISSSPLAGLAASTSPRTRRPWCREGSPLCPSCTGKMLHEPWRNCRASVMTISSSSSSGRDRQRPRIRPPRGPSSDLVMVRPWRRIRKRRCLSRVTLRVKWSESIYSVLIWRVCF